MSKAQWFVVALVLILPLSAWIEIASSAHRAPLWWARFVVIGVLAVGYVLDQQRQAKRRP